MILEMQEQDFYYLDSVMFGGSILGTPGCTDPTALNYDPLATVDDGSCTYAPSFHRLIYQFHGMIQQLTIQCLTLVEMHLH